MFMTVKIVWKLLHSCKLVTSYEIFLKFLTVLHCCVGVFESERKHLFRYEGYAVTLTCP